MRFGRDFWADRDLIGLIRILRSLRGQIVDWSLETRADWVSNLRGLSKGLRKTDGTLMSLDLWPERGQTPVEHGD